MKGVSWYLLERFARLLDRRDWEAVLGDLQETSEGALVSWLEVVGLFVRRQAILWKNWRPWLAAFGVAVPTSFLLMGFSLSISLTWHRFIRDGSPAMAGQTTDPGFLLLVCQVVLLAGWAWSSGFVVGSVSRRTLWVSLLAYCVPCLFCLSRFRVESLSRFCLLLFLLPAVLGISQGLRISRIRPAVALAIAIVVTALLISARHWSGQNWRSPGAWVLNATLTWPAWFLAATTWRTPAVPALDSLDGAGDAPS